MKCPIFSILVLSLSLAACAQKVSADEEPKSQEKKNPHVGALGSGSRSGVATKGSKMLIKAGSKRQLIGMDHIKNVVRAYNKTTAVKMKLEKKVTLGLLGDEKKSEGELIFSKGKLRMEIKKPDKVLLIMNGQNIWVENKLSKEMGGKIQVSKMTTPKGKAKKRAPLAFLLHTEEVWDEFRIVKTKQEVGSSYYALKPKVPEQMPEIVTLKVMIKNKTGAIEKLSFSDELENITTFDFSNVRFNTKVKKSAFNYTPPKGAEITEY